MFANHLGCQDRTGLVEAYSSFIGVGYHKKVAEFMVDLLFISYIQGGPPRTPEGVFSLAGVGPKIGHLIMFFAYELITVSALFCWVLPICH